MRPSIALLYAGLAAASVGCTSFSTVRSAEVREGLSLTLQASTTTPPGDEVAWFWAFDCAERCDHMISSFDVAATIGSSGAPAFSFGAGLNGLLNPYLEGYLQLRQSPSTPFGIGGRLGLPVTGWASHQLYARYDVPVWSGRTLLLNPGIFYHTGNSPNGELPGHFIALVQGIGLQFGSETASIVPAMSVGVGRGERESYGNAIGPFTTVFGAASVSITLQRRRTTAPEL